MREQDEMDYEAEIAEGLLEIASKEIASLIGKDGSLGKSHRPDSLPFHYRGNFQNLLGLRKVIAVYRLLRFELPRPKALLGHQHFQRMIEAIRPIITHAKFQSLYLSAAGSDSSVMQRLKQEIAQALKLDIGEDEGDLLLRIRRSPYKEAWELLIRLSPRPLASRDWRICNYQGALNASVASAMLSLLNLTEGETFLNIASGSGTILIEREQESPAARLIGLDNSMEALECARQNFQAAGCENIELIHGDAMKLPFTAASMDNLAADLPFGQLVGSHSENQKLYPVMLREAARVAKAGARFVLISHEIKLMEQCLRTSKDWTILKQQMVTLSGLHPRIFLLERR